MLKASFIYLFSSFLNKLVPFLLLPFLTEYLSPTEYGTIAIIQVFISLFIATYGVLNANIPRTFYSSKGQRFASYISAIFVVLLIIFITTTLLTVSYVYVGFPIIGLSLNWFIVMPVIACMSMANLIYLTLLRTQEKPYQYAAWEISHTVFNLTLSLGLVIGFHAGWEGRAIGITLPIILYGCFSIWALARQNQLSLRWDWSDVKEIFSVSLPLIPHALSAVVITSSDRLFIKEMLGDEAVGIYSIGYQFGMVVMVFTDSFLKAWQPWFFKKMADDSLKNKKEIVGNTRLYLVALVICALIYSKISQILLPFVVNERYLSARSIIFPIVISYIAFGAYQIIYPYIVHVRKTYVMMIISPVAAITNIVLNYLLIPKLGINGAAYATIASYAISSVFVFLFANYYLPMPWFFKKKL